MERKKKQEMKIELEDDGKFGDQTSVESSAMLLVNDLEQLRAEEARVARQKRRSCPISVSMSQPFHVQLVIPANLPHKMTEHEAENGFRDLWCYFLFSQNMCHFWPMRTVSKALPFWRFYSAKRGSLELDYASAREWYSRFNALQSLPDVGEVTYARSSGPGGQNVNKVNSKAQLRVPIDRLLPLVPLVLHQGILSSRYYAEKSSSLVIQADESRKAQANKDACFQKLNELILDVYHNTVPGETTDEQKEKVKRFQKAENEARLKRKKLQSSKKQSRSKGDMV